MLNFGNELKKEVSRNENPNVKNIINKDYGELKQIFKKGGLVVGKKDRRVLSLAQKKIGKIKIPCIVSRVVEDIYYIADNLHSLVIGSTRSGKTRCEVVETIENCALAGESMIISDPKGELYEYAGIGLEKLGYKVLTLDFKNPLKSSHYNFLQPVIDAVLKNDIPLAENRANDIVQTLVGEAKGERIWNDGEKSTIKAGIMSVVVENAKEHPEYCNLYNVYMFLAEMCKEQADKTMLMDSFLEDLIQNHPANKAFQPASIAAPRTRQSFFTSALNTLNLFTDPYIATMMANTEITAEHISTEKTALFLILPDEKITFYSLCSLFVSQIYQQFVEIADKNGGILKKRVNFILDEFGNFAPIPNFGGFLTVGGGRGIRFNLFMQSISQLNEKYGDNTAMNILDNCYVWTYLKTSNDSTAEKISKKIRNLYYI